MCADFKRPKEGYTFAFNGMKLNSAPETVPPDKSVLAVNVRGYSDTHMKTRPGWVQRFTTNASIVTDMGSYAVLGTDNLPRILVHLANDQLWLDTGTLVTTLAGAVISTGATLLPFRPNQSPNPYLYVANGSDYLKISAPNASNVAIAQKVGIAEPQSAPEAVINSLSRYGFSSTAADYTQAGTAGAPSAGTRISDTVQSAFIDPTIGNIQIWTLGVSTGKLYARGMEIVLNGSFAPSIQDVFPAQPNSVGVAGIYYFTGTTGRCIVVPRNIFSGPGTEGESLYLQNFLGSLRRGGLIKFGGAVVETCLILSVSKGPDGSICIETSTTSAHTSAETITAPGAIQIFLNGAATPVAGQTLTAGVFTSALTTGVGTLTTANLGSAPFTGVGAGSFQPDDLIHVSVKVATLASLTEMKILFDVGDGTFTQNFYYYTIRASDVTAAVQNTLTQLGAAQLVTQRRIIDEEHAAASGNQLATSSGAQTSPGDGQWADIMFSIRELTRVGSDQTKTLQNTGKMQFLFNVSGATSVSIGGSSIWGAYQPDVGPSGAPYVYRVRPRSSVTGAMGNPSPATRYGVNPRRERILLTMPSSAYDTQIDTWDIFRYGGTVTSWRKIGQVAAQSGSTVLFFDNYSDNTAAAGEHLDFDNYEPWPSIDIPFNVGGVVVTGTTALVPVTVQVDNILRMLPGNLMRINSANVYTLRSRPTLVQVAGVDTLLFQFEENAGAIASATVSIYEPTIARQFLPYMWGPDSYGTVFACGDPLRLGTVYFAKPNNPDSAPDRFNLEIVAPSEPLQGGEVLDGLSFVASTERWWALYPQLSNPVQRYAPIQQPIPRGLAAPRGHCTDGREIFFWAKDGIWSHRQGSLTDADLYNLFPHEGVPGESAMLYGNAVYAPDYAYAAGFRLVHSNGFLYATYQSTDGFYRALTYDMRRKAWCVDDYAGVVTSIFHVAQKEGNAATQPMLLAGTTSGKVGGQTANANDFGQPIFAQVNTFEWDGGDLRFGGSIWGDAVLDATLPAQAGMSVTLVQEQAALLPSIALAQRATRDQSILSLGGGLVANFLGLVLSWTDDFSQQTAATELHLWQPSFLDKPETIADRITDWDDAGSPGNKWWQGFVLHADTEGAAKALAVRDADTRTLHPFTPVVNHAVESQRAYSFDTPFLAHSVRIEPQDQVPWRFYAAVWVTEPSPELAETWQTQGTSHEMQGYQHVKQVSVAYAATQPVTLAITSYDGQSPVAIVLPMTGGAMQKITRQLTPNKGTLYFYKATSAAPFQLFLPDWEILVGQWGRDSSYVRYQALGGPKGDQAKI